MATSAIPTVGQIPRRPPVTLDKTTPVTCSCGGQVFRGDFFMIREASRLITGEAQDGIGSLPVVTCIKCGQILEKMLPPELQEKKVDILGK